MVQLIIVKFLFFNIEKFSLELSSKFAIDSSSKSKSESANNALINETFCNCPEDRTFIIVLSNTDVSLEENNLVILRSDLMGYFHKANCHVKFQELCMRHTSANQYCLS